MIAEEGEKMKRICVDAILREVIPKPCKSMVPIIRFLIADTAEEIHQGEVHDGFQLCVSLGKFTASLPWSHPYVVVNPRFSHDVVARIFKFHSLVPPCHGFCITIGISVLPNAVNACIFSPPDGCLDEIIHDERIPLIEVRHFFCEPSVSSQQTFSLRRMRVSQCS